MVLYTFAGGMMVIFGLKREKTLNVGVVGLGLIGGSLAKAIKTYTDHVVYGADADSDVLTQAMEWSVIDDRLSDALLPKCDLLLLALYPRQAVDFVRENLGSFRPGCVIVDMCGVKQFVMDSVFELCKQHDVVFIGGHPMAGRECWGFSGSDRDLFKNSSMILTPDDSVPDSALELLTNLFADLGFAGITRATPEAHDKMIAFTSQLAHVVSSAYIKSPTAQQHNGFSAGSYKDLTRVAKLNAPMWCELFLENSDALVSEIDTITSHLREYRDAISSGDGELLLRLLEDGKAIKEALDR